MTNFAMFFRIKINFGGDMSNKAIFWKNLSMVIVVVLMGALLIASYFIPVMKPSETYRVDGVDKNYSCRDVVVAMNATDIEDLSTAQVEALFAVSESEGTAGKLIRVVGVLGMINAMIGAAILICAIATIILRNNNILRVAAIAFAIAALAVSIAMIALICSYLGIVTESTHPYAFYYSVGASSFVMLGASLFAGTGSWFLGFFDRFGANDIKA